MIPTFTHLEASRNSSNLSAYTTGSVSAAADSLLVVDVHSTIGTGPINTPTISGLSLTWTQVATQARTDTRRTTRFRALVSGAASGAITIDFASQVQSDCSWAITQITDCLLTGTNGADAIEQSKTGASGGTASSYSLTFDATWDHADNRALAAFSHNSDSRTFTAGTNFTLLGQTLGTGSSTGFATEHGRDSDDAVDIDAGGGALVWIGVVSEIVGAADAPPPSASIVLRRTRRRGINTRIN
jgi:hypothetical protein